ncbi:MAG: DUF5320 domain-containing protein [Candidatus Thermoplasmatota archaeon]|jgi:hypothetical protein|nr:DUF5320 domain-containing protein [Candidatus Thermoplasmatota archaeon]
MPCGDGTGPWWTQERYLRCWRTPGFGRGWRYRIPITEPLILSKEEQKKILEEQLKELEIEKQEITKKLKELEDEKL